jgi:hypothetical protein
MEWDTNYGIDNLNDIQGRNALQIYTLPDGTRLTFQSSKSDNYKYNNFLRGAKGWQLDAMIQYYFKHGSYPSKEQLASIMKQHGKDSSINDTQYNLLKKDFNRFLSLNNYTPEDVTKMVTDKQTQEALKINDPEAYAQQQEELYKDTAYNAYYRDIYSTEDGTTGGDIYNALVEAEQNAALSNMQLAEANYQQQAMQQAQTVKNITDQVRAERVARLRAGMSEAQIANQDMQMLMSNVNALNQHMADANAARFQAQQQYQNAQDTAYQAWLSNANAMAQSGAAYAASDAGDIMQKARQYAAATGVSLPEAVKVMTGNTGNK